jgi:hypothetical protein
MDIFQQLVVNFSKNYKSMIDDPKYMMKLSKIKRGFSDSFSETNHYKFEYLGLYGLYYQSSDGQEYSWLDLYGHNSIEFIEEYRKNSDISDDEIDFFESIESKYVSIINHLDDIVELDKDTRDKILQFQVHMSRCQLYMKEMPEVRSCIFVSYDDFFKVIKEDLTRIKTSHVVNGVEQKINLYDDLLLKAEEYILLSI